MALGHKGTNIRVRVFDSRVPRIKIGLTREEVTGGWRKLHLE